MDGNGDDCLSLNSDLCSNCEKALQNVSIDISVSNLSGMTYILYT